MRMLHLVLARLCLALVAPPPRERERGDVPGWVLITVMSAGIVVAIGGLAKDQLGEMLTAALNKVN